MNEYPEKKYAFFQHRDCEFFPCHKGVAEEDFNCLFCWCPLYALGQNCGGAFRYLADGTKDCSACAKPHRRDNYDAIVEKFPELQKLARKT